MPSFHKDALERGKEEEAVRLKRGDADMMEAEGGAPTLHLRTQSSTVHPPSQPRRLSPPSPPACLRYRRP